MPKKNNKKTEEWICEICKSDPTKTKKDWTFKNNAGLSGHNSFYHRLPAATIDKMSEQEKADLKELSEIEQTIKSKETFSPGEKDDLREKIQPLRARLALRDAVAKEKLEADKKEHIKRGKNADEDDDDYAPSWKELDRQKRRKIGYGGEDNSMTQFLQSQMLRDDRVRERERETEKEYFKERIETQKQIFQIGADSNKQNIEFMKQQLEKAEKEKSPFEKIKELKDWTESEGYTKENESPLPALINANLPAIMDMFKDYVSLKKQQQQGVFTPPVEPETPPPAPVIPSNSNSPSEMEVSGSSPPSPDNHNLEGGEPVAESPPQELTDEEYSKKYDLSEHGYDNSDSPFTGMYDEINKGYVAPTTTSPMTETP